MIIIRIWLCAIGFISDLWEMSTMKCCAVVLLSLVWVQAAVGLCPSLCSCRSSKALEGAVAEPLPGESLRLKCGGNPVQVTELKEIDLSKLWSVVVSL